MWEMEVPIIFTSASRLGSMQIQVYLGRNGADVMMECLIVYLSRHKRFPVHDFIADMHGTRDTSRTESEYMLSSGNLSHLVSLLSNECVQLQRWTMTHHVGRIMQS